MTEDPRRRQGVPYDPDFDYRGFPFDPDTDRPLLTTKQASLLLGLSTQGTRDLMDAGSLPFVLGDQLCNRRRSSPRWAVAGLADHRAAALPGQTRSAAPPGPPRPSPDADELRGEVARLRAENSDLRLAWSAMRAASALLADADRDRDAAANDLRRAERRQASAEGKAGGLPVGRRTPSLPTSCPATPATPERPAAPRARPRPPPRGRCAPPRPRTR